MNENLYINYLNSLDFLFSQKQSFLYGLRKEMNIVGKYSDLAAENF